MRIWATMVTVLAAGCGATEEEKKQEDPPVWLAFQVQGKVDSAVLGIRLAPPMRTIEATLGAGAARVSPDGSKLVAKSLTSRAAADSAAIHAAFKQAGLQVTQLQGEAHAQAIQALLKGEWLSAAEVYDLAMNEVRKMAEGWARHGANALGLSDQDAVKLRDALAQEAIAAVGGGTDVKGGIRSGWAGIVDRAVKKACGMMSTRAQETIRRAVSEGGP